MLHMVEKLNNFFESNPDRRADAANNGESSSGVSSMMDPKRRESSAVQPKAMSKKDLSLAVDDSDDNEKQAESGQKPPTESISEKVHSSKHNVFPFSFYFGFLCLY